MLARVGVRDVDELLGAIPKDARYPKLGVGAGMSELEVQAHLERLAAMNTTAGSGPFFIGGAIQRRYIPAAVPALALRGEFLTAYTPYQPEVSQGTLQAVWEYQSLMAELLAVGGVNSSMYDGASATARAGARGRRDADRAARDGGDRGGMPRRAAPGCLRDARRRQDDRRRGARGGRALRAGDGAARLRPPRAARRARRRHRRGRRPAARHRHVVRRATPRDLRLPRAARAADARTYRRPDRGCERYPRLREHAADARAAHPSREGDEQHLHE